MVQGPLGDDAARRLLNRAAYGPRPGDVARVGRMTTAEWLEAQFAQPAADPAIDAQLATLTLHIRYPAGPGEQFVDENRPFTTLAMTQRQRWALAEGRGIAWAERERPRWELAVATLARKVLAQDQLRERMVEFWHDHFNVAAQGGAHVMVSLPDHDARIRRHALGNFGALLEAMATSPAMLAYLNNRSSRAGAPNENYARELMELHTLGAAAYHPDAHSWRDVPGATQGRPAGYFDGDVWEAARAFTGWTVAWGQRVDGAVVLPQSGDFAYVERWHDNYQKRLLGQELAPFQAAMADGRRVLALCATHPATARHLCTKLARFLIGEPQPSAAIDRAVAAFTRHRDAPDQIGRTLRALLDGPEVTAAGFGRVRRPLDMVTAAARGLGIPLVANGAVVNEMGRAGQLLFSWPTPDGQTLDGAWYLGAGVLRARWQMLLSLAQNAWGTGASPLWAQFATATVADAAREFASLLLGRDGPDVALRLQGAWAVDRRPDRLRNPADAAVLGSLALLAPGFQTT